MSQTTLRIPYKIPHSRLVSMFITMLAFAGIAYLMSTTNHKAVQLEGVITLSPTQANDFYLILSMFFLVISIYPVWRAYLGRKQSGFIEFLPDAVVLPKVSLHSTTLTVPYKSIKTIQIREIHHQRFLVIKSSVGENRLLPMGFVTDNEFNNFYHVLRQRIAS